MRTNTSTEEYHVHKDDIIAFATLLEQSELRNGIGYVLDYYVVIHVWYDPDDPVHTAYLTKFQAIDDGDYKPDPIDEKNN